jgi:hypothetical protein
MGKGNTPIKLEQWPAILNWMVNILSENVDKTGKGSFSLRTLIKGTEHEGRVNDISRYLQVIGVIERGPKSFGGPHSWKLDLSRGEITVDDVAKARKAIAAESKPKLEVVKTKPKTKAKPKVKPASVSKSNPSLPLDELLPLLAEAAEVTKLEMATLREENAKLKAQLAATDKFGGALAELLDALTAPATS